MGLGCRASKLFFKKWGWLWRLCGPTDIRLKNVFENEIKINRRYFINDLFDKIIDFNYYVSIVLLNK